MPYPDYLDANPRVIFFTDFDGTITLQDTNDYITDNYGFGREKRTGYNPHIISGKISFRDGFQDMINSWNMPFTQAVEILKANIQLDPGFKAFMRWARANNVPVVVVSSGMVPVIKTLLSQLVGDDLVQDIEIVANDTQLVAPGYSLEKADGWNIKFRDESDFGHDKSRAIRPYAEHIAKLPLDQRPTLLYAGDGVSDLSAARETDLLFAKEGRDLVEYCEQAKVPFTTFNDWNDILGATKDIYEGKVSVKKTAEEGLKRVRTNSIEKPRRTHRASSLDEAAAGQFRRENLHN
ncbi:hypothetical protein DV738_g5212, partial [Chaetothyriales sp. CBS 135597]